jgi:hypothetical protein
LGVTHQELTSRDLETRELGWLIVNADLPMVHFLFALVILSEHLQQAFAFLDSLAGIGMRGV